MKINFTNEQIELMIGALAFTSSVDVSYNYSNKLNQEMVDLALKLSKNANLSANNSFYIPSFVDYDNITLVGILRNLFKKDDTDKNLLEEAYFNLYDEHLKHIDTCDIEVTVNQDCDQLLSSLMSKYDVSKSAIVNGLLKLEILKKCNMNNESAGFNENNNG